MWQEKLESSPVDLVRGRADFKTVTEEGVEDWLSALSRDDAQRIVFEAEMYYNNSHTLENELNELRLNLNESTLRYRLKKVMDELRAYEAANDETKSAKKLEECNKISQELNQLSLDKIESV